MKGTPVYTVTAQLCWVLLWAVRAGPVHTTPEHLATAATLQATHTQLNHGVYKDVFQASP